MKKILKVDRNNPAIKVQDGKTYLYRIASVSIDKVTLEKHLVTLMDTFNNDYIRSAELNDETKVGTVTQKMQTSLIADISKRVDEVAVDFEMDEKSIKSVYFIGVTSV